MMVPPERFSWFPVVRCHCRVLATRTSQDASLQHALRDAAEKGLENDGSSQFTLTMPLYEIPCVNIGGCRQIQLSLT